MDGLHALATQRYAEQPLGFGRVGRCQRDLSEWAFLSVRPFQKAAPRGLRGVARREEAGAEIEKS